MDIGNVLSEAWSLYKRFLWQFFLTALVVFAALDLLSALAARDGDANGRADRTGDAHRADPTAELEVRA